MYKLSIINWKDLADKN